MTERKRTAQTGSHRERKLNQLKDEVYRQMFRLEAKRPGSETDLAIALLRAWIASESTLRCDQERQWLNKICPVCLAMLEAARPPSNTARACLQ